VRSWEHAQTCPLVQRLQRPEAQSWEQRWWEVQMCFVAQHVVLRSWSLPHMGVAVTVVVPRGCCSRGVKHTAFVRTWPCLPMHTHVCLVSLGYVLAYCLVSGSAYLAGLPHSLEPLVLSYTSSQTCVVLHYTHFRRLSLQLLSLCLSVGTCVECL
jgi:hypothetical protein